MTADNMRRQAVRLERALSQCERSAFYLGEECQLTRKEERPVFPWPDWMEEIRRIKDRLEIAFDLAKNAAVECGLLIKDADLFYTPRRPA